MLETKFFAPVQAQFNKLRDEEKQLEAESASHPDDALARSNFNKKSIEARSFYAKALEKELELRKKMHDQLAEARRAAQAAIQGPLKPVRAQLDAQANVDSVPAILASAAAEPTDNKFISYAGVRTQIETYGTQLQALYAAQEQSLESVDDYLNRPSETSLLLQGVFQGVKTELGAELPKLGEFGKTLAGPLNQLLDSSEKSLEKAADGLSTTIDQKLNGVLADLTKSASGKAAEAVAPSSNSSSK